MKITTWIKENSILLILVIIGSFLRFYKLTFQDIWIDEIFSMVHSSPSKRYTEIYEFLKAYDPHPPLYYYSIRFFSGLFEHSVFIVRAFSAVLGVAGILSIYALGKELMNKNVGLIAAALLVINSFHIYYSQEARMYSMLFLTTTLSFYYLVKFIKNPNLKWVFAYTIFSSAMIYTHFFGLFTLVSQYLILLFFILKPFENNRKRIFLLSLLTGLSTIIIYIPAIKIIMVSEQTTSYWIQLPEADFFTQLIKKFFGNSEIVLYFVVSLILYFLLKLYQQKSSNKFEINPTKKKLIFTFFIIMVWIVTTYSIPLILSFVKLPMLIDRYFINILPAILLLVACGLYKIKDIVVQIGILSLIILFSLINLIFVKDYYNTVTKSEFTKLTDEIIKRNSENSKIVTHWSWLLPYFFENNPQMLVENNNSLDDYIEGLKNGAIFPKAFWYVDGHFRPFQISGDHQEYLNQNFILKEKLDYFDVWANYYVPRNSNASVFKNKLNLDMFNEATFDANGYMVLFENSTKATNTIILEKGDYNLTVIGFSLPEKPIKNENAHLIIKRNGTEIANFNLSEKPKLEKNVFSFSVKDDGSSVFQIIFDNDVFDNGMDRNAIIKSIKLEKKQLIN
jgi:hypothetical protein